MKDKFNKKTVEKMCDEVDALIAFFKAKDAISRKKNQQYSSKKEMKK